MQTKCNIAILMQQRMYAKNGKNIWFRIFIFEL